MSKFIALPVGQGDAFYYERKEFSILVDGGRSKLKISDILNHEKIMRLDVLVCTHNDADHANGVLGLLQNWRGEIGEVWLPASWSYKMKDLLKNPRDFYHSLIAESRQESEYQSLENLSENIQSLEYSPHFEEMPPIEELLDEDAIEIGGCLISSIYARYLSIHWPFAPPLLFEAIEAAERIREIAISAYKSGIKIRFFEFTDRQPPSGGIVGILQPVNAKEVFPKTLNNLSPLMYLYLTMANRESLVFFSPEEEENPAVLFTADSDLEFNLPNLPPKNPLIVTSPHHGSESNKDAYTKVNKWLNRNTAIWVRSDCKSKKRPGKTYLSQSERYCTLCNTSTSKLQAVALDSQPKKGWHTRNNQCSCS